MSSHVIRGLITNVVGISILFGVAYVAELVPYAWLALGKLFVCSVLFSPSSVVCVRVRMFVPRSMLPRWPAHSSGRREES